MEEQPGVFRGWLPKRPTFLLLGWWLGGLMGGFSILVARMISKKQLKGAWLVDAGLAPFVGGSLMFCLSFPLFSLWFYLLYKMENRLPHLVLSFSFIQAGLVTAGGLPDLSGHGIWIAPVIWMMQVLGWTAAALAFRKWRLQQLGNEWRMIHAENDVRRADANSRSDKGPGV